MNSGGPNDKKPAAKQVYVPLALWTLLSLALMAAMFWFRASQPSAADWGIFRLGGSFTGWTWLVSAYLLAVILSTWVDHWNRRRPKPFFYDDQWLRWLWVQALIGVIIGLYLLVSFLLTPDILAAIKPIEFKPIEFKPIEFLYLAALAFSIYRGITVYRVYQPIDLLTMIIWETIQIMNRDRILGRIWFIATLSRLLLAFGKSDKAPAETARSPVKAETTPSPVKAETTPSPVMSLLAALAAYLLIAYGNRLTFASQQVAEAQQLLHSLKRVAAEGPAKTEKDVAVTKLLREQVLKDLFLVQQALYQRRWAGWGFTYQQQAVHTGDLLAHKAIQPAQSLLESNDTDRFHYATILTHLNDLVKIRLVPYHNTVLIGLRYVTALSTQDENALDYLTIPHEVGHHVYWYGTVAGSPIHEKLNGEYERLTAGEKPQQSFAARWLEEIFADSYGTAVAGPISILGLQELLLCRPEYERDQDSPDHPIPHLRVLLQLTMLEKLKAQTPASVPTPLAEPTTNATAQGEPGPVNWWQSAEVENIRTALESRWHKACGITELRDKVYSTLEHWGTNQTGSRDAASAAIDATQHNNAAAGSPKTLPGREILSQLEPTLDAIVAILSQLPVHGSWTPGWKPDQIDTVNALYAAFTETVTKLQDEMITPQRKKAIQPLAFLEQPQTIESLRRAWGDEGGDANFGRKR